MSDTMTIVGGAADGEEALALVRLERPDLVITDLIMPRLNGIELTRRIRQELPATSVILMSSYTEDAYRLMASDSGELAVRRRDRRDADLLAHMEAAGRALRLAQEPAGRSNFRSVPPDSSKPTAGRS